MSFEPTIIGRIRQCPRCELRFADEWELEDHLAVDHDMERLSHVFMGDRESPLNH
ncbi:MAG TPA: hypothetical protein VKU88_02795 [Acidimicrobiales bacterium]|nr:hypothetical protein [Acidimicrobiales bacterium]